ncbi:phosphoserine phosphatase [Allocatelliglobosispora scoriae]|uniref:Phosphoserine phosphatase n=1 Tax=Allocatelliglobosispora scoriae TaxID=643052 RepID=A0A841BNV7_9ACTN|nr:haloacid dehalogenase-like hydrolase [Allocatelliglobosispora scoriae]MBB5868490.1 phosphoserine phosphatase [Allocatelliglobosispora scoriae]
MTGPAAHAPIALLDLDGTLFDGVVGQQYVRRLGARSVHSRSVAARANAAVSRYVASGQRFHQMAEHVYSLYGRLIAGLPTADAAVLAAEAWAEIRTGFLPCTTGIMKILRRHGYRPLIISGSPNEIVQLAAAELQVEEAIGAVAQQRDGLMTGRLDLAPGLPGGKVAALRTLVGRTEPAWLGSLAIGNSPSDAELFDLVGHPIAFEPDEALARLATARGWAIANRRNVEDLVEHVVGRSQ